MSALVEYKCEVCGRTLVNLDADCPQCTNNEGFVDLTSAQFIQRFEKEPLPTAFMALARSAIAGENFAATGDAAPIVVTSAGQSVEQDGCDFVRAVFLVLEYMDCPPDVRDFVLCIAGVTGGDSKAWFKIPDGMIADHMGFSREWIGKKRAALIAWERSIDHAVIEIKQQERDPVTKHYGITEYRAPIIAVAALFIRRARAVSHARSKNGAYALKDATAKGLKEHLPQYGIAEVSDAESREIVNELKDDLPTAPLAKRRFGNSRNITPPANSFTRYTDKKHRAARLIIEACGDALNLGIKPEQTVADVFAEVNDKMTEQNSQ